jgi:hypothetical protein
MGSVVLSLWPDYRSNWKAARLLQQMVWLGALKDCADLAREASFDTGIDQTGGFAVLCGYEARGVRDLKPGLLKPFPRIFSSFSS